MDKSRDIYLTDTAWFCARNTAALSGGQYLTKRWADIIDPPVEDDRSAEEITADVVRRCGLTVVDE